MFNTIILQQELQKCAWPSGNEQSIGEKLKDLAAPYVDEAYIDSSGNVICHKSGKGARFMVAARMDIIGLIVKYIDEFGFIWFERIGDVPLAHVFNTCVIFQSGIRGVIRPSKMKTIMQHDSTDSLSCKDAYIDIGASTRAEAEKFVKTGDVAKYYDLAYEIGGGNIMTPYANDLAGCIAMLKALERIDVCKNDMYFVFTTQEEFLLRGAGPVACRISPDVGIVIGVAAAGDTLSEDGKNLGMKLGSGPAIKAMDELSAGDHQVYTWLKQIATTAGIAYQPEVLARCVMDSSAVQYMGGGLPVSTIGIPTRHIHSPAEIYNIQDVDQISRLLAAVSENGW